MSLLRLEPLALALAWLPGCSSSSNPSQPRPSGLMVAGGQNAAFLGDAFTLSAWFTDAAGEPMGCAPASIVWTSSDPAVVEVGQYGALTARSIGTATLTATASDSERVLHAAREFRVLGRLRGKVAWVRRPAPG